LVGGIMVPALRMLMSMLPNWSR